MIKCETITIYQIVHANEFQKKYRVFGADGEREAIDSVVRHLKDSGKAYGIGGIDGNGNRLISFWATCMHGGKQVYDVITSYEPVSQNKD